MIKVKFDINKLDKIKKLAQNQDLKLFANEELYQLSEKYTPCDTTDLVKTTSVSVKGIHYKVPYANNVYYGEHMKFSKDMHSLATAKWDKVAYQNNKEQYLNRLKEKVEGII
ncbi:MAG: hypothetical protein ATN36_06590 [Epulopiscium sp. Nele67-Bin005]|nr:MAG: hypothetical protein ATN36_06590 [Epulopiscium sp. Nele67-Bin005]